MILRHVIEHMKHQHWTAIWIDLVIVIVGVFLGTQVSNWNTERETRQKSAVFTERLKADLRVEAWAYEFLIDYNKDVLANARRALDALSGDRPLSDEQFVISAYRATQYEASDRRRATYDELVSTGTISLIVDQKLRETAIMVYATPLIDQIMNGGKQSEYREIFRKTVSAPVQEDLMNKCSDRIVLPLDYAGIVHTLDYPCKLDAPADKIHAAAEALRSREGLVSALQLRFADVGTDRVNLEQYSPMLLHNLREVAGRQQ
jgi:hypothetical protein